MANPDGSWAPRPPSLDVVPIPDLHLVRGFDQQQRVLRLSIAPVEASGGCPHACAFCIVTGVFGQRFRHRTWSAQTRIEVGSDEALLALIRRAGCITASVGIESVDPVALEEMNRHPPADEILGLMARFRRHKIPVHGMFVVGMDTDTPASIRATVAWAARARVSSAHFLILSPFPGTRIYEKLLREGRILFTDRLLYDGHHVTFQPARMTPAQLQNLQLEAHRNFSSGRRSLARLLSFDAHAAGIYLYARSLQRAWRRSNRVFR